MFIILNGILKGLFEWLYGLFLDLIAYCANSLLGVMSTDLTFFETNVPVIKSMVTVFIAVGWALLLGNCVFQAMKAMMSGLGFEAESPVTLFGRTFVFGFLLLGSRAICNIGLGLAKNIINLLGVPTKVVLTTPKSDAFSAGDASWVLVIIIGVILGIQLIKLFFEIGERYVVVAILTFMAPMGFAMGGSKATKEIFSGYIRMYASMLLMMVMNVVFLKLILSALATMPTGLLILPWCVLVVAIAKVARKIDNIISKIGLNPAITGDPLGRGSNMMAMMAARTIMNSVSKTKAGGKTGGGKASGSSRSSSTVKNAGAMSTSASSFSGSNQNTGPTSQNSNTGSTNANQSTNQSANSKQNQNTAANQYNQSGMNANAQTNQNSRFGSSQNAQNTNSSISGGNSSAQSSQKNMQVGNVTATAGKGGTVGTQPGGLGTKVNTNRFGTGAKPANTGANKSKAGVNPVAAAKSGNTTKGTAKTTAAGTKGKIPGVSPTAKANKPGVSPAKTGKPASNAPKKSNAPSAGKTRGIKQNANTQKPANMKSAAGTKGAAPKSTQTARPPKNTGGKNTAAPVNKPAETKEIKVDKKPVNIDIEVDDDV